MASNDLSDLIIEDVLFSARFTSAAGAKRTNSSRSAWAIVLKIEGKTVYRVGSKEIVSDAQHPVILSAGCNYSWECIESGDYLLIEFKCNRADGKLYSFSLNDNSPIVKNFLRIEHSRANHPEAYKAADKQSLYSILIALTESRRQSYIGSDKYEIIKPAITYISENYSNNDISNDYLAEMCGVSTVYFRKLFTSFFSISPIKYLNRLRMEKAKVMLKSDFDSVSEVAESVGYPDIYQFSKAFKSATGLSPTQYVKTRKK